MRIFELDKRFSIVCETEGTRNGFKHTAVLLSNGSSVGKETKICYLNRTWERFTYESVLFQAINNFFTEYEAVKYKEIVKCFS